MFSLDKIFGFLKFGVHKILGLKRIRVIQIFWTQTIFWVRKMFMVQKRSWVLKKFWVWMNLKFEKIWGQNKFSIEKILLPEILWSEKNLGSEKFWPTEISVWKNFVLKKALSKENLGWKLLCFQKLSCTRQFWVRKY